ncbi:MAG TPA: ABC transporter substrate-binding protein [Solirubrobacteraceae bacterium]|nr:ABC transporter substrate-binding protein [Solirubrobacteraceae bacterium]
MRIASLVPHATELLFALGAGGDVLGVTHECDHPPEVAELERLTRDVLPAGLSAREIDEAVRERTLNGESIYELDQATLTELDPELIVTQALCPVCAVSFEEVEEIARTLPSSPRVVALDPKTLGETLGDVRTLGEATGRERAAEELLGTAAGRIDAVRSAVEGAPPRRVLALEWLDPVFVAGHWTPQLIELAGGQDVLGLAGEPSQELDWEALRSARAEIVVVMPCGYDARRAREEAFARREQLAGLGAPTVVAVDAAAYFSRPGPRLIDGLELLAHILHPERVAAPPAGAQALEVELTVPS